MNIIQSIARKLNRKCPLIHPWTCAATAVLCLLLITSCSGSSPADDITPDNNKGNTSTDSKLPVLFTTDSIATRTIITDTELQSMGFGVFAYYTEANEWKATTNPTPNFMYNQSVTGQTNSSKQTTWTYNPVKYWPNDNATADDGNAPGEEHTATGSKEHSYLSFFAYAPYTNVDVSDGTAVAKPTIGITALTANTTAGDPKVTYAAPSSPDLSSAVDLLWGVAARTVYSSIGAQSNTTKGLPLLNLTKPAANEMVRFQFRHALSQLRLTIQAAFDELKPENNDIDENSRILVNSITITGLGPQSAVLNLDNTTANTPLWENITTETPTKHTIQLTNTSTNTVGGTDYLMNDEIRNTYTTDDTKTTIKDQYTGLTATAFSSLPAGVTKTKKPVYNITDGTSESDWAYLFIPAQFDAATKDALTALNTLDVSISYDVITHDESLVRNDPAGFSIIRNNISQTLTLGDGYNFKPGYQYQLNIILGMTTVKFGLEEISGWGTGDEIKRPIVFSVDIKDYDDGGDIKIKVE